MENVQMDLMQFGEWFENIAPLKMRLLSHYNFIMYKIKLLLPSQLNSLA